MSESDDEVPPRPSTRRALLLFLAGPVLRLAFAGSALLAIATGAERIHAGAGYLVAGLLVWLELARVDRRGSGEDQP